MTFPKNSATFTSIKSENYVEPAFLAGRFLPRTAFWSNQSWEIRACPSSTTGVPFILVETLEHRRRGRHGFHPTFSRQLQTVKARRAVADHLWDFLFG